MQLELAWPILSNHCPLLFLRPLKGMNGKKMNETEISGYSFTARAITAYIAPEAPRDPIEVAPIRNLNK